jgi:SAM-dependent methyltransferase
VNSFGCGNPLAFAEVAPGEVVLDLGSGAGIDLLLAARRVGPGGRVIGIDMTDEMIAKARQNIAAAGFANVEVRKGLIEDLPVESSSVDWVISNCVINLSPEKDRVFAEIVRVLKPGGRVSISDIVVDEMPDWLRQNAAAYCACLGGAIPEEAYRAGLRAAGLGDVEVTDRLVYTKEQLLELVESELDGGVAPSSGCCSVSLGDLARQLAPGFEGKVWSARFAARKPESGPTAGA